MAVTIDGSANTVTAAATSLSTATGSAPSYSARAWVNFNGTGTVAIRESGNISSITDNARGDYTLNFINALPDTNYSVTGSGTFITTGQYTALCTVATTTTTAQIVTWGSFTATDTRDGAINSVAIFR